MALIRFWLDGPLGDFSASCSIFAASPPMGGCDTTLKPRTSIVPRRRPAAALVWPGWWGWSGSARYQLDKGALFSTHTFLFCMLLRLRRRAERRRASLGGFHRQLLGRLEVNTDELSRRLALITGSTSCSCFTACKFRACFATWPRRQQIQDLRRLRGVHFLPFPQEAITGSWNLEPNAAVCLAGRR